MKQIIAIAVILFSVNSAVACLDASQNRMFPLGQTTSGLLVVETRLQRTMYIDTMRKVRTKSPGWYGISYFKIYDIEQKELHSEVIDTIRLFEENRYDSIIGNSFKKGMKIAKTYPHFIEATPISISFCGYQENCDNAALVADTLRNTLNVKLKKRKTYVVRPLFDTASIASNILNYYSGFDDADLSAKSFKNMLSVNSVRRFQIGENILTVVHIGSGEKLESADGELLTGGIAHAVKYTFTNLNNSVFKEPVLHHGHGFDFALWE